MSSVLPPDCKGLIDAPYHIVDAISLALRFLSFEELPHEDRPPKRIWFDGDRLKEHWAMVDARMKAKFGGGGIDTTVDGPSKENDAARDLII